MLFAHVLGDFEPPQCLDLPLRRAVPYRVSAPEHMIGAEPLDQCPHERSAEAWVRRSRHRERGSDIGVDITDPMLGRDLSEIRYPFDVPVLLELGERRLGRLS